MRGINRMSGLLRHPYSYRGEYCNLIRLGMPVMITQIGIVVVSFADTIMVARCGTPELGSAAFVNSLFMVVIVMQFGFSGGLTPLVGKLFSRGDSSGVGEMLRAGLVSNVLLSLVFTLIMGVLYFFIDRMGQPEELMPLVRPYYLIMLCTLLPMAIFNAFQQSSNGCTDTSTPMWLIISSNVLNIMGNWLLIGGEMGFPRLGLAGAGLSTLISRLFAMVAIVLIYILSRSRRPYMQGFGNAPRGARRGQLKMVWLTSYPVMIQSGIECLLWSVGGVVSGWFGTVQLASYQVCNIVAQLGFMIFMGFGVATSIRVANYVGLREFDNVRRITTAGLHLILLLAAIASLTFYLFFRPLVGFFTPDSDVDAAAIPLLLPLILYQFCDAVQLTYANALRGTSLVKPLLWVALLSYIVVGIPLMLLLAVGLNLQNVGVYYSFTLALSVAAIGLCLSFRKAVRRLESGEENVSADMEI